MNYPGRTDAWISLLLWSLMLLCLVIAALILNEGKPQAPLLVIVLLMAAGLHAWILWGTSCEITSTELIARCGPFRRKIPLEEIQQVQPLDSFRWMMYAGLKSLRLALSSKLVLIRHARPGKPVWLLVVSPFDRTPFVEELASAAGLTPREDGSFAR